MLKIFKYLKPKEYVLFAFLLIFLVGQIWCDVTLPMYTAEIVTKMQAGETAASILQTGYIMLAYTAGNVICTIIQAFLAAAISTGVSKRLRGMVYGKALSLSATETGKFTTGSLLTRTTNDVQQVSAVLVLGLRLGLGAPLMAVLAIIRIAQSSGELTIATAIGVLVLLAGLLTIMFVIMPKFKLVQRLTDRLNGVTRENLTGIRVVRAYNAEKYEETKFDKINKELKETNLFTGRMTAALSPLISLVSYGVTLAIYWLGCWIIVRDNNAAFFPTMFSFVQLAAQVIMAFMILLMLLTWLPRAQVSAKRIHEVLDSTSTVVEPENPQPFTEEGTVEFVNVSFGYAGEEKPVLHNISFRAESGETVAIIGATGSGKTTMLSLIERFFDASVGEVRVNGVNVRELASGELRGVIGYVPQKSNLFSGTLRENITFSDGTMSEDNMQRAIEIACADEFIGRLDEGLNSRVAQGGKNFSGGQKQRISIARAVAANPQILLFDDCFSALDYATDARVRKNLKERVPNVTKLVVAQRIGTVKDADKIIVLEGGEAVGIGRHEELLRTCDIYKKIALSQLSEEELDL